jgi:hypothetical protein
VVPPHGKTNVKGRGFSGEVPENPDRIVMVNDGWLVSTFLKKSWREKIFCRYIFDQVTHPPLKVTGNDRQIAKRF